MPLVLPKDCPEYRLRLFLSVDLVGSTAFKAKHAHRRASGAPYAAWLHITKSFYREFPEEINKAYDSFAPQYRECVTAVTNKHPKVWKTVGDEILFCCRLVCLEHLALCMTAFAAALEKYGKDIHSQEQELDVKGSAWIAAFPAPNSTIVSAVKIAPSENMSAVGDTLDENYEAQADLNPGQFDFLGKSIDTGFRISRFAQSDELSLSLELAYLLTLLKQLRLVNFDFIFKGREPLKGVINSAPYPIVCIETEKSVKRKELSSLERTVTRTEFADTVTLRNYIHAFMESHSIEVPILTLLNETEQPTEKVYPKCFLDFRDAYGDGLTGDKIQQKGLAEAEAVSDDGPPPDEETKAAVEGFAEEKIKTYSIRIGKSFHI